MVGSIKVLILLGTVGFLAGFEGVATCATQVAGDGPKQVRMAGKTIEAVLEEYTDRLMSLPGVVGTAIGECDGKPCIKVLVVKKTPELLKKIGPTLEGYLVVIEETGEFRALDSE